MLVHLTPQCEFHKHFCYLLLLFFWILSWKNIIRSTKWWCFLKLIKIINCFNWLTVHFGFIFEWIFVLLEFTWTCLNMKVLIVASVTYFLDVSKVFLHSSLFASTASPAFRSASTPVVNQWGFGPALFLYISVQMIDLSQISFHPIFYLLFINRRFRFVVSYISCKWKYYFTCIF